MSKVFSTFRLLPKSTFFIVGCEFAERFAFYGLTAILPLYLSQVLLFSEDVSTSLYHLFKALAYISPLMGSLLADAVLGKFLVIGPGTIAYACGMSFIAATSFLGLNHVAILAIGLFVVAMATGAIKSVVSAFLGDQVEAMQIEKRDEGHDDNNDGDQANATQSQDVAVMDSAFSLFYASIQAGSLLTFVVTPILRTQVPPPYNYSISLAVPAALLWVASGCFFAGSRLYVRRPARGSDILRLMKLVIHALRIKWDTCRRRRRRGRRRGGQEEEMEVEEERSDVEMIESESVVTTSNETSTSSSWLDCAVPPYSSQEVQDVLATWGVLRVFLTLPIYWALSDQQGSRWIFQLQRMNRHIPFTNWTFPPEAGGLFNPVLVLALLPIINALSRRLQLTPLRGRMLVGMLCNASAFVVSAILEFVIVATSGNVFFLWQLPQYVLVCAAEVLVYLTGLEFAYSEAPASMKSILQAFFLLTVAIGNGLVALLALLSGALVSQAVEYLVYASMMLLSTAVFYWQIRGYKYRQKANE